MYRDGGVVPRPRKCLTPGVTHRDRRGIDAVPILHATKRTRQINLLCPGVGQGPLGQGFHALLQANVEPPVAGGPRHVWHLTLQVRAQDIRLVGSPRCPRRDHQRPHEHPEVQLALSLNDAKLLAEPVDLLPGPHRLEDLSHLVTRHGLVLRSVLACRLRLMSCWRASRARTTPSVKEVGLR
jgi:hypothetical protein